jgi:hypothetical protein
MPINKSFALAGLISLAILSAVPAWGQTTEYQIDKVPYAPYLAPDKLTVVASFDGGKAIDRWKDILTFAKDSGVKFTFFVSSVYFVPDAQKHRYLYPADPNRSGVSDIDFGGTAEEVDQRIALVQQALADGHDVESHLNGHFNGVRWTEAMWKMEFEEFNTLCPFLIAKPAHVRFPLLAMNSEAFPAMAENGVKSITSFYDKDFHLFNRVKFADQGATHTVIEFPISFEHENGASILLMDYNFYLYDQKYHINMATAEADMVKLYLDEAAKCFKEKRPFFISHHFSNWNHAAYWNAMKAVIGELKKTYAVDYLTVSQLYARVAS